MKPLRGRTGERVGAVAAVIMLAATAALAQGDERTRVFEASMDRVWMLARLTLREQGWDIEKEDKKAGWMRTDARRLEGEDFGVYAGGTKHRLRVVLKSVPNGNTSVTVEHRVWKEDRILWMNKEQELPATDHRVEQEILDAIGAAL